MFSGVIIENMHKKLDIFYNGKNPKLNLGGMSHKRLNFYFEAIMGLIHLMMRKINSWSNGMELWLWN